MMRFASAFVCWQATDYCFEDTAFELPDALDVRVETASLQYAKRFYVAVPSL